MCRITKASLALLTALTTAAALSAAFAAPEYLDDRSDAASLVRSLYNAINRKEYARAYSYFAEPPADDVEAYAQGFADTESVELLTGTPSTEGAAGSAYFSLPVAIRARKTDGSEAFFAGCYTLRLANPEVQADAFTPLQIENGELKAADGPLEAALPASCGEGPALPAADAALRKAEARFDAVYGDICLPVGQDAAPEAARPESHAIPFNYRTDPADAPKRQARLFRFFCSSGAYNELHVYFLADDTGEILPLHFATPELSIRYRDDDPEKEVEDVQIVGYTSQDRLMNSRYDPDTLTITSNAKWRGAGDASENGVWAFRDGTFTLVRYEVDASYDGEINPQPLLDFFTGP